MAPTRATYGSLMHLAPPSGPKGSMLLLAVAMLPILVLCLITITLHWQ